MKKGTKKRLSQVQETKIIDFQTGEVKEQQKTNIFSADREPDFIKLYIDHICYLADCQGWTSKILNELIKLSSYASDGQLVIINAALKRMISAKIDMKPQTITNGINELCKKQILIKKDQGIYQLNPYCFGRGDWKSISKLRYEVELSKKGAKIENIQLENEEICATLEA